jgi:hypothetical protein
VWTHTTEGRWLYTDQRIVSPPVAPQFVSPVFGATGVDPTQAIEWTTVPGAEGYALSLGVTPVTRDLLDLPELFATKYQGNAMAGLPQGTLVFATLGTRINGDWLFTYHAFSVRSVARLLDPHDGATDVPLDTSFSWAPIDQAEAYRLTVGTAPGLNDVVDSGEVNDWSWVAGTELPTERQLYARLWTRIAGTWSYVDTTFFTR